MQLTLHEKPAQKLRRQEGAMQGHEKDRMTFVEFLERVTELLEAALAVVVMAGFILSFIPIIIDLPDMLSSADTGTFEIFLERSLNLVIGIEFVRMLIKHTPGSVLEVLMFAIARHMVLDGGSAVENLLGVAAIAGIFAIRRFIYVHSFLSRRDDSSFDWLSGELREEAKKKSEKQ
ncbi:MAG: transporter [Lachnospiraceae bacterium]|nr:transporter [Lachnospiraceae bacterium]